MRLTDEVRLYRHHSDRLMKGGSPAEQAESTEFLARLGDAGKIPDRVDPKLIKVLMTHSEDQQSALAVRANALHTLVILLGRPAKTEFYSDTGRHTIVDRGIVSVLAVCVTGADDVLREDCARGALLMADCCHGCRKRLSEEGLDTHILQQMISGGFDASAEATRSALGTIITMYNNHRTSWSPVTVAQVIPAFSHSLARLGADDTTTGQFALTVLSRIGDYDAIRAHPELVNYMASAISSHKQEFARLALQVMYTISRTAAAGHWRPPITAAHIQALSHWVLVPDQSAIAAEYLLRRISAETADVLTGVVLSSPALISQMAVSIRPETAWRGCPAIIIFAKVLESVTSGGPTPQSEFLLGFGFLQRFIATVSVLHPIDPILANARTALNSVLTAHPEWSRKSYEAGASLPPLLLALRLRADKQGQWYVVCDEDCEAI